MGSGRAFGKLRKPRAVSWIVRGSGEGRVVLNLGIDGCGVGRGRVVPHLTDVFQFDFPIGLDHDCIYTIH